MDLLHKLRFFMPKGLIRGEDKGRVLPGVGHCSMPDNTPSVADQLRTCEYCRHFRPKDLEFWQKRQILPFLQREAHILPEPDFGDTPPPPGYEAFRAAEAGYCTQLPETLTQQKAKACEAYDPDYGKLATWFQRFPSSRASFDLAGYRAEQDRKERAARETAQLDTALEIHPRRR